MRAVLSVLLLGVLIGPVLAETRLEGQFQQGGLVIGITDPDNIVRLGDRRLRVALDGTFVFGFHRDAPGAEILRVTAPDGRTERQSLTIEKRDYDIQRIDGLPEAQITPPARVLDRIRREAAVIRERRARDTAEPLFLSGFIRPAPGRITGVYGSLRILNGKPRRPHYGIDFAAPEGTPVVAPADGIVTLAEPDLYYSGGTVILDHGHGLSSAFLHMASLAVKACDRLSQGDVLGTVGATGRATGPHLDWRINWFERRLDPGLLLPAPR